MAFEVYSEGEEHVYQSPVNVKLIIIPLFFLTGLSMPEPRLVHSRYSKNVFDDKEIENKRNPERKMIQSYPFLFRTEQNS